VSNNSTFFLTELFPGAVIHGSLQAQYLIFSVAGASLFGFPRFPLVLKWFEYPNPLTMGPTSTKEEIFSGCSRAKYIAIRLPDEQPIRVA